MPDYAIFKLSVSVLTPLHIGSGVELLNEYDYAIHGQRTWRINDSALLDAQNVDDPALADRLATIPPVQLLNEEDFKPESGFFRYIIKGIPRSQAQGAVVREQIKDTFDRPYLPGSSFKGALRTALGWAIWQQKQLKPDPGLLGSRREWAAQAYEHEIFGPTPNKDLMKAVQVSDSQPVSPERLIILNASVLNPSGLGTSIPVELEAIRSDTTFEMTLKLDLALFSDWARQNGGALPGGEWLAALPGAVRAHARSRIQQELAWFHGLTSAPRLLSFYQQLDRASLASNQFLLQLGWGTGWDGKTFGTHLKQDGAFMRRILRDFRLRRGNSSENDPFPKSRRVAVAFTQQPDGKKTLTPALPLGWVLVTLEPVKGLPPDWIALAERTAVGLVLATQLAAQAAPAPTTGQPSAAQPAAKPAPTAAQVSARQPSDRRPAAPSKPAVEPAGPPSAFKDEFTRLPQKGYQFTGEVIFTETNGVIFLEIPGLSADDLAMAFLSPKDNPRLPKMTENQAVTCEVISLEEEPNNKGHWLVRCRLIQVKP